MFRSVFIFAFLLTGSMVRAESLITEIESALSVKIIYNEKVEDNWDAVSYKDCDDSAELNRYLLLLRTEYLKYPSGFFKKVGIDRIVLGKKMYYEKQQRAAVPDPYTKTLFLGIDGGQGNASQVYLVHVMHHELNHITEYAMWNDMFYRWPEWEKTNRRRFRYDPGGGSKAYEDLSVDWYTMCHPRKGFFNRYSLMGEEEDRSEVISLIMSDQERNFIYEYGKKDKILRKKILLVQQQLNSFMGTTDSYWATILAAY
ncbi:MAG: hypothetical protein ACJ77K_05815 [Bacteroidia bacterium]